MKKVLFGLIATILFGFIGNAQDPSNPSNKYDYIGVLHNKGLESFISNYKNVKNLENNKVINLEALLNMNTLYLGEDKSLLKFNSSFNNDINFKKYIEAISSKNVDFVDGLAILNFKPTNDFKNIYNKIMTEIDIIDIKNIETLNKFISNIKNLEELISKSSFANNDKEILLSTTAISRHSAVYWFKTLNNKNEWNPQNQSNINSKQIIKLDVAGGAGGAVVGAIVGGTVTIYAFGIGAIPGWAAGAITGAVGGSISQAVLELWEWMFGD
jgi:hypothetical protein